MKKMINTRISKNGVSEVVGTVLLLGICVAIFSVLYFIVLSEPFETSEPHPTIVAFVEGNNVVIEHRGGDELSKNGEFEYTIGGTKYKTQISSVLDDTNSDGKWNLGERLYIPIEYNLSNSTVDLFGSDAENNRAILSGTLDISPESDIGIELKVDNRNPKIGDSINITIVVTNYRGDIDASSIRIKCLIPDGLEYWRHFPADSNYDNATGIWVINKEIPIRGSVSLKIEVNVTGTNTYIEPTQLAMVLDGSGSISDHDWNLIRNGLANAIENESVFPHDGSVELTVVQFGEVNPPCAKVEISPVIVDETNYQTISDTIRGMNQMVNSYHSGATPMSCGLRLAADQLHNIGDFDADKRQVINLVTDGIPNCEWISGGYTGKWLGNGWYKNSDHSHSGLYSAGSGSSYYGEMISVDLNTKDANSITVDFWYRLDDTETNDLKLYYYDGDSYNLIASLGGKKENKWLHYVNTITDSEYFIPNFRIRFDSSTSQGENIWIDDLVIQTGTDVLLQDGFENTPWNINWWNFGKSSTENATAYLIDLLEMTEDQDELDSLAVGSGPDIFWLKNKIVWPQPGYEAPPYDNGPGWVNHTLTFEDFEKAINEMIKIQFDSIKTTVKLVQLDSRDPNPDNDKFTITVIPEGK